MMYSMLSCLWAQLSKVSSDHQSQQALDAEAKRCASRFVHEDRHVTTIQRKLQTLADQQQAAINNKVLSLSFLDIVASLYLHFV